MSTMYRTRLKGHKAIRQNITIKPEVLEALDRLRELFHRRWPEAAYPTISYTMELVMQKNIPLFNRNPAELAKSLEFFERKYPAGTQPHQDNSDEGQV